MLWGDEEPNTQHRCCGNKSCNNHVDPLAPSLSHVALRKFFAPATLQQPCARLCVSRPSRAMPKSPPERPNQWEQGSRQQWPLPWPAADAAAFPPLASNRNTRMPQDPAPKALAKPMGPYNVFVPKAPLPTEPPPLGRQVARGESASADSTGTQYSDVEWRASDVKGGKVRRYVNDGPRMGPATSSLTAAGSSAASSLTAAGGSDRTVANQERMRAEAAPAIWPIGDEKFAAWLRPKSGQPDPPSVAPVQQPPAASLSCSLGALGPVYYRHIS